MSRTTPSPRPSRKPRNDRSKWSDAVRRQERIRADQQIQEARELEEQAKRLRDEARDRRRRRQALERHQTQVKAAQGQMGVDPHRPLTEVPALPPGFEEVTRQPIKPPFSFVRISYNEERSEHLYEVLEPRLTDLEQEVFDFLRDTLVRTLEGRDRDEEDAEKVLETAVLTAVTDHAVMIDDISMRRIRYHLIRDFLGYGPIDVLMNDPQLEDISCDGPGVPVYLFHRNIESVRTNIVFDDDLALDSFVIRLAQQSGKHISIAEPMLDATLPDGSRLQATLSREVTTRGSSFTIRRFREDPLTPTDLLAFGTVDDRLAAYMWFLMEHGQSIIMAGGTASGKTTTLNAISQFIPPEKKIVSIEDTREINLQHENWIAGVTRTGFGGRDNSGNRAGTINMFALLEAALRQRPEFLLVGEVRGAEAVTLFQAMATGHAVYSTMHADSAESAVYRLENPPINVPRMMLQTLDGLAIQRQVRVGDKMTRRIVDFTELVGFDPDTRDLLTNTVFRWDVAKDKHIFTGKSFLLDKIAEMQNMTTAEVMQEWDNRMRVLRWMRQNGVRDFREFAKIVSHYYHRPDLVLAKIDAEEGTERPAPPVREGDKAETSPDESDDFVPDTIDVGSPRTETATPTVDPAPTAPEAKADDGPIAPTTARPPRPARTADEGPRTHADTSHAARRPEAEREVEVAAAPPAAVPLKGPSPFRDVRSPETGPGPAAEAPDPAKGRDPEPADGNGDEDDVLELMPFDDEVIEGPHTIIDLEEEDGTD